MISFLLVSTFDNPIYFILFLILIFCNASVILFLFGLEFLALTFVVICVGATAVLFLLVVMLLNLKVFNTKGSILYNFFVYLTAVMAWLLLYLFVEEYFFGLDGPYSDNYFDLQGLGSITYDYQKNFDGMNNVDVLGQVLYNYFTPCFLVAGLLLLVAMLSAIVCINIKFLR